MKKFYSTILLITLLGCTINAQYVVFGDTYAAGVTFVEFGGSVNTLSIDNTQFYTGTSSIKIPVTTGYTGGAFVSATPQDLSTYNAITFWAKNDKPAYKLDGVGLGNTASDATTKYAVERNGVTLSATWTKYYIPIPVASKLTAETGLFHFAEGSGEGAYNIWIDDVKYENVMGGIIGTPTAAFATETQAREVGGTFSANGTTSTFPVNSINQQMQTSKAYFTYTTTPSGIASFDAFGIGTALAAGSTSITAKLGAVTATGTLTLNVTNIVAPNTAASTPPARNVGDVISLFSGAYSDVAGTDWFPNWSQSTVVSDVNIATNPTKKYVNFNYQGVQFASPINASGMSKLHLDIWTPNAISFNVVPIVIGRPEVAKVLTPTVGGWSSFDIDLATIGTTPLSSIIQFKFEGSPAGATVYLDNIYFWKGTPLPVTLTDFKATKRGNTNVLSWITAAEINSKVFIAERSGNGIDWSIIQSVDANGSAAASNQYSAIDNSPLKGINYYRLKMVDKDGKFNYSKIVALNGSLGIKNFAVFPNPFVNDVKISINSEAVADAEIRILSVDGRTLINRKMPIQKGDNILVVKDLGNLSKGNYILEINTQRDKLTQKISKN